MQLARGILISETKLKPEVIYNLDVPDNAHLDINDGVLIEEILEMPDFGKGKGGNLYINPITKEQWYEVYDRPLTKLEIEQEQAEKIDLILQMQLNMFGII